MRVSDVRSFQINGDVPRILKSWTVGPQAGPTPRHDSRVRGASICVLGLGWGRCMPTDLEGGLFDAIGSGAWRSMKASLRLA